jgi:hypothetical protein
MADLMKELVDGVVKSVVSEILKKTGLTGTTRRKKRTTTKRKTATRSTLSRTSGTRKKTTRSPAKKQVSRRRTVKARSKPRQRAR